MSLPDERIPPLPHPEFLQASAAEGWLELGNPVEAIREFESIRKEFRGHPDLLDLRCRILDATGRWEIALIVSRTFCNQYPKRLEGWLHQAKSLNKIGRTHEAYHLLVDVVELFPGNQTIRYQIALYAVQRGLIEESLEWLKIVFETDGDGAYRRKALSEPAFDFLRPQIKEL